MLYLREGQGPEMRLLSGLASQYPEGLVKNDEA